MTASAKKAQDSRMEHRSVLTATGGISVRLSHPAEFVTEQSASTQTHIHDCYEIYVYLGGEIGFVVHDRIYNLAPGDAIVTRANTYHHSIVRKACVHEHYCILLETEDPEVTELLDCLAKLTHLHFDADGNGKFLKLLANLEENFGENGSPLAVRAALYHLLSFLENSRTSSDSPPDDYPEPLSDILKFIGENFATLQSVEEIADRFFISIASLERLFTKHLRTTPYCYLSGIRLASAKRALDAGESVTEAALRSGFSDCSHFIQRFKKEFGITPNRYRNS